MKTIFSRVFHYYKSENKKSSLQWKCNGGCCNIVTMFMYSTLTTCLCWAICGIDTNYLCLCNDHPVGVGVGLQTAISFWIPFACNELTWVVQNDKWMFAFNNFWLGGQHVQSVEYRSLLGKPIKFLNWLQKCHKSVHALSTMSPYCTFHSAFFHKHNLKKL